MLGWFRRKNRNDPLRNTARAAFDRARESARDLLERERADLRVRGFEFAFSETTMLSVEAQYLFGVFLELAQDYDLPAAPLDRAKLHLTDHLVSERGMDPTMARDYATGIENLHKENDEVLALIVARGRAAYRSGKIGHLAEIVRMLHDRGLNSAAYKKDPAAAPDRGPP